MYGHFFKRITPFERYYKLYLFYFQEIREAGGPGYEFISVEEDHAANVLYVNNTLLHLPPVDIPRGAMVSFLWIN